jgi:hypothetical protein
VLLSSDIGSIGHATGGVQHLLLSFHNIPG